MNVKNLMHLVSLEKELYSSRYDQNTEHISWYEHGQSPNVRNLCFCFFLFLLENLADYL